MVQQRNWGVPRLATSRSAVRSRPQNRLVTEADAWPAWFESLLLGHNFRIARYRSVSQAVRAEPRLHCSPSAM